MILVVYLGHEIFHPVAVLVLSKSGFWVKNGISGINVFTLLTSYTEDPEKKRVAPLPPSYHASGSRHRPHAAKRPVDEGGN